LAAPVRLANSYVDTFVVTRDGFTLADALTTTTLIDASVIFNVQYCYQVLGYDFNGQLISAMDVASKWAASCAWRMGNPARS